MLLDAMTTIGSVGVIADAAVTWTPKSFYIAAAIVHTVVFLLGFKLLQTDPEHNTFVGALLAAVIANLAAFGLRDMGLAGVLMTGTILFIGLVAISSGEVIKSVVVFLVAVAAYAGMGHFLVPRTPLDADKIGGLPRVVMDGGIEAEPITEKQADDMSAPASSDK